MSPGKDETCVYGYIYILYIYLFIHIYIYIYIYIYTGVNFSAKDVKYHAYCRIKYQAAAEGKVNRKRRLAGKDIPTDKTTIIWRKSTETHKRLLEALASYLEEIVFAKKEVLLLTDINTFTIIWLLNLEEKNSIQ